MTAPDCYYCGGPAALQLHFDRVVSAEGVDIPNGARFAHLGRNVRGVVRDACERCAEPTFQARRAARRAGAFSRALAAGKVDPRPEELDAWLQKGRVPYGFVER